MKFKSGFFFLGFLLISNSILAQKANVNYSRYSKAAEESAFLINYPNRYQNSSEIPKEDNSELGLGMHHLMLYVSDMKQTVSFYESIFGLEVDQRFSYLKIEKEGIEDSISTNLVFMHFPGDTFILELMERDSLPHRDQPSPHYQHFGIHTDQIEKIYQKALDQGATQGSGIRNVDANGVKVKNAFLRGPDGEFIELIQFIKKEK